MARHQSDLKYRETRLRETVHRMVAAISNVADRVDREDDSLFDAIKAAVNEFWPTRGKCSRRPSAAAVSDVPPGRGETTMDAKTFDKLMTANKAREMWVAMNVNDRAGIRFGMFPFAKDDRGRKGRLQRPRARRGAHGLREARRRDARLRVAPSQKSEARDCRPWPLSRSGSPGPARSGRGAHRRRDKRLYAQVTRPQRQPAR